MSKILYRTVRQIYVAGIILGATLPPHVRADGCSTINNVSRNLGTPTNQHCTNWCHVFTAALMMSKELQKSGALKTGEQIHPLMVGGARFLLASENPSQSLKEGGAPAESLQAINAATRNGERLCKLSDLGPDTGLTSPVFKSSAAAAMGIFRGSLENPATNVCELNSVAKKNLGNLADASAEASIQAWGRLLHQKCSVKVAKPFLFFNDFDEDRFNQLQSSNPVPDNPNAAARFGPNLDFALEHDKIAAVLMDVKFLKDPNRKRTPEQLACSSKMKDSGVGLHWTSIVGREKGADGTCNYLIRNTWGTSCDGAMDPKKCKEGYYWVSKNQLMQKICDLQYIK